MRAILQPFKLNLTTEIQACNCCSVTIRSNTIPAYAKFNKMDPGPILNILNEINSN